MNTVATTSSHTFRSSPVKCRPAKRPRLELEEDMEEVLSVAPDPADTTYAPAQSISNASVSQVFTPPSSSYEDAKYIVFEQCLLSLFENCPQCASVCKVQHYRRGTFIAVTQDCPRCTFYRQWRSQPLVGSIPAGDLQLSAAILFSGASFMKTNEMFDLLRLKTHTYDAFRRHARTYLQPAVIHTWNKWQGDAFDALISNGPVILGGDMRADSPGHSAKYGSYSMMNLRTNKIIDLQLVQSNEVGGSYHMEEEELIRSLQVMEAKGVKVDAVISDRHRQVQKVLRDHNIDHLSDIWHVAKGLSKKIKEICKDRDSDLVKKWHRSITNHLYWTATTSKSASEKVAKWMSLVNHLQNIHTHPNPEFPKCLHPPKRARVGAKWFKPGSPAFNRLHRVITNKQLLSDVEKLSPQHQTSTVKSFHSLILRFAPKNVVYPYIGMLCRLYLAALHFNENSDRPRKTSATGKHVYRMSFPSAKKGGHVVKPVKTEAAFGYANNMIKLVFDEMVLDPQPYLTELQKIPVPPTLCSTLEQPTMEDAVAQHTSRFNQVGV